MRPIGRIAFFALLVAAALPATAFAGGWATVEVDGQPVGLSAGEPWRVELLVKQHGVTPLDGMTPSVRIDNGAGAVHTFEARPTGRPGTYAAVVTYPSAGTWKTRLFDGFTDATPHRLAPVTMPAAGAGESVIGTPRATGAARPALEASGAPWPQLVAIGLVAVAFTVAIAICGVPPARRRRRGAVPQQYLPTP